MEYSARDYEVLYDQASAQDTGSLRAGVKRQRTKTIRAGDCLEVECYPIWATRVEATKARQARAKRQEAQKRLNERNAVKKLCRKINANFGCGDIFITNTYDGAPESDKQAARDMRNYIARIRRAWNKQCAGKELKYIYVTEVSQTPERGTRYHHHMIISGGLSRETLESLWGHGYSNSRAARPTDDGLNGLAHYMTKKKATQQKMIRRGWCASKNLRDPDIRYADRKMSMRKAEKIARGVREEARAIYEKLYPGYRLVESTVKRSEFVTGVYMYARMIRIGKQRKE